MSWSELRKLQMTSFQLFWSLHRNMRVLMDQIKEVPSSSVFLNCQSMDWRWSIAKFLKWCEVWCNTFYWPVVYILPVHSITNVTFRNENKSVRASPGLPPRQYFHSCRPTFHFKLEMKMFCSLIFPLPPPWWHLLPDEHLGTWLLAD